MVAELMDFFGRFHGRFGFAGTPLHDPLAVAAVIEPAILGTRRLPVVVETRGEHTTGRTVVDFWGVTGLAANVDVALEVNRDRFMELVTEALLRYD